MASRRLLKVAAPVLLWGLAALASGQTPSPTPSSTAPAQESPTPASKAIQFIPAPVAYNNDVNGWSGGTALVLYDPISQTKLVNQYLTNLGPYGAYSAGFEWRRPGQWIFDLTATLGSDVQDYFGEGDRTTTAYQGYNSRLNQAAVTLQFNLLPGLYAGPALQYLSRQWLTGAPGLPPFPNESEWRMGLQVLWEGRDDVIETHRGFYYRWGLFTLPALGLDGFGTDVWQAEFETRQFATVLDNVILAGRFSAAWTQGDPSYSFEYFLGGNNQLRGYHTNRFRGTRFYVAQGEVRFPLFDQFYGSTSLDLGDATDGSFAGPLASYQVGLRWTWPTRYGLVLRFDFGVAGDSTGTRISFAEPF